MKDFRKLKVWREAHVLTLAVYEATAAFPREEAYGLTSQIRRACASIPANIAEGCGRDGETEFGRFLYIAQGSASELDYHLLLAHDLRMLESDTYHTISAQVDQVRRRLTGLIKSVRSGERRATSD